MSQYGGISQIEFLAILFVDTQRHTHALRKIWLQEHFGKSYADELNVAEASRAIEMLREERAAGKSGDVDGEYDL